MRGGLTLLLGGMECLCLLPFEIRSRDIESFVGVEMSSAADRRSMAMKHVSHTRFASLSLGRTFFLLLLQSPHTTPPHAKQRFLRRITQKFSPQFAQCDASFSGSQCEGSDSMLYTPSLEPKCGDVCAIC